MGRLSGQWGARLSRAHVHARRRIFAWTYEEGRGAGGCIAASLMRPGLSLDLLLLPSCSHFGSLLPRRRAGMAQIWRTGSRRA
eukprot:8714711-Pyramimonas_sp.AAC.1